MEEPRRRKPPPLPENFLSLQQLQEMRLREQEQKRTEERQRKLIEEEEEKNKLEKQREEEEQEKVRKSVEALRIADGGRRSGFRGRRVGERMVFREVKERDDSTEADQKEEEAEMAIQMTKKKLNKRKAARRRAVAAAAETGIVKPPDMKLDEAKIGVEEKEAVLVAEIAGEPAEATVVVKAKIVPKARKLQGRRARYAADLSAKSAAEELETVDGGEKGAESPCEKLDSATEVSGEAAEVGISTNDAVSLETKVVPNRRWKIRGLAARSAGSKSGAVTVNGAEKGDESAVAIEAGVSGKPVAALGAEVGMRSQQGRGPRYVARKSAAAEAALKGGGQRRWGRGGGVGGKWVPKGAEGTEGNGI